MSDAMSDGVIMAAKTARRDNAAHNSNKNSGRAEAEHHLHAAAAHQAHHRDHGAA